MGLLGFLIAGVPTGASAQEAKPQEFQVQAGGYRITVIADPSRLSLGTVLYSITVVNSEDARPVSDAQVIINATHEADGSSGWAAALNQPSNPGTYEATVQLEGAGTWLTSVDVSSPLGRVQVETPPVTIPQPRETLSGSLVFVGAFLAILLGAAYVIWSSRKAIEAREASREN